MPSRQIKSPPRNAREEKRCFNHSICLEKKGSRPKAYIYILFVVRFDKCPFHAVDQDVYKPVAKMMSGPIATQFEAYNAQYANHFSHANIADSHERYAISRFVRC